MIQITADPAAAANDANALAIYLVAMSAVVVVAAILVIIFGDVIMFDRRKPEPSQPVVVNIVIAVLSVTAVALSVGSVHVAAGPPTPTSSSSELMHPVSTTPRT